MIKKIAISCFISTFFCLQLIPVYATTNQDLYNEAMAFEKASDYTTAVETMAELLKLEPKNDVYLAYASHVERLAGDFKKGLEHSLAAIKINSKVGWYYVSAVLNAYGEGDIEKVKKYGKKVITLGSKKVGADNYTSVQNILKNIADREYNITWTLNPTQGYKKNNLYYVPLPSTGLPYQTATYLIAGNKNLKAIKENGNDIYYFSTATPLTITANVDIKYYSFKSLLDKYKDSGKLPLDVKQFLGTSEGIKPKSKVIQNILVDLKTSNKLETIKNILTWMKENITYKIEDYHTVEEIIDRGYGECGGYSALFTALARGAGIPARIVWGVIEDPTPDHQFAPEGHLKGHAWAEFYLTGIGWVPVEPQDISTLGRLPTSYIRMYHYDMKGKRWSSINYHASNNMGSMGGDTPEFEY